MLATPEKRILTFGKKEQQKKNLIARAYIVPSTNFPPHLSIAKARNAAPSARCRFHPTPSLQR